MSGIIMYIYYSYVLCKNVLVKRGNLIPGSWPEPTPGHFKRPALCAEESTAVG